VGSESVSADATGLVATPQEVLDAYIDALNNPTGENGTAFADDTLRQRIAAERAIDLGGMGTVTVTAAAGSDGFKGLGATPDGATGATGATGPRGADGATQDLSAYATKEWVTTQFPDLSGVSY